MSDVVFEDDQSNFNSNYGSQTNNSGDIMSRNNHETMGFKILRKMHLAKTEHQASVVEACMALFFILSTAAIYGHYVAGNNFGLFRSRTNPLTQEQIDKLPQNIREKILQIQKKQPQKASL